MCGWKRSPCGEKKYESYVPAVAPSLRIADLVYLGKEDGANDQGERHSQHWRLASAPSGTHRAFGALGPSHTIR